MGDYLSDRFFNRLGIYPLKHGLSELLEPFLILALGRRMAGLTATFSQRTQRASPAITAFARYPDISGQALALGLTVSTGQGA
jgi:hypothetical protein